jgi:hypothetical protein
MRYPFDAREALIVTCDCGEATCATRLELTPDGILSVEDADGLLVSIDLPEWLDDAMRSAIHAHRSSEPVAQDDQTMWPEPTVDQPDWETLEEWMNEGICEATDGCVIEPDGVCIHGHVSWLLELGLI